MPASTLIQVVGRTQFLVVVGLRSCFLPGCGQGAVPAPAVYALVLALWLPPSEHSVSLQERL